MSVGRWFLEKRFLVGWLHACIAVCIAIAIAAFMARGKRRIAL